MSSRDLARIRTVRLTTRGRRTGQRRTVTIWFVENGARSVLVQHATSAAANWYRNLLDDPSVEIDFGDGPIPARAAPISDPVRVREVLAAVRRKYWSARLIQWIGRKATPVAAEIRW
jgi:deazaflavin-dependent oxidoreductase (nitroreductase family)